MPSFWAGVHSLQLPYIIYQGKHTPLFLMWFLSAELTQTHACVGFDMAWVADVVFVEVAA